MGAKRPDEQGQIVKGASDVEAWSEGPFALFLAALGTCVVAVRAMREGGRELVGALGDVLALPPPPNRHTDPEIVRARAALREAQAVLRDTET